MSTERVEAEGAERAVLSCILQDGELMTDVVDDITLSDFSDHRNGEVYYAMTKLYDRRLGIDVLTVGSELRNTSRLIDAGGDDYIVGLLDEVPTPSHIKEYTSIVHNAGIRRRLVDFGNKVSRDAIKSDDLKATLSSLEKELNDITDTGERADFVNISDELGNQLREIDYVYKHKGELTGVPTGITSLDDILGGLQKSDLIILAARPAMGKSTLALNIAYNCAVNQDKEILFYSLEMSTAQLVSRLMSSVSGVNSERMRTGDLTQDEFSKIYNASGEISELPIKFCDVADVTVRRILTLARREAHKHDVGLIVIDYLQLINSTRRSDNRVQEISEISRNLKLMAKELNVPVLALSQLSRNVEQREDHRPMLSDLRDSGSIEQDADVVMMLYRDGYYNKQCESPNVTELIVNKHRNGATGTVNLYFRPEQLRFDSMEVKEK